MTFEYEPTLYAQNLAEYAALEETEFLPTESKEEIIGKLKDIALKKKAIADVQNKIIGEYIERFEKGTEVLDEDAAEKLYAFLDSLRDPQIRFQDAPVCIRISRLLYPFYHDRNDAERVIPVIYAGTMCEMLLGQNLDSHGFFDFPKLCEEYLSDIDKLSPGSRLALIKAYMLRIIVKDAEGTRVLPELFVSVYKKISSCMDMIEDKNDVALINFFMVNNFLSMTSDALRIDADRVKHGKSPEYMIKIEENRELFESCLKTLSDSLVEFPQLTMQMISDMCIACETSFLLGHISFEELLTQIDDSAEKNDTDGMGDLIMILASGQYLLWLHAFSPYSKEETERMARKKIDEAMPRILEMKKHRVLYFSDFILQFVGATSLFTGFYEFYDIVLAFTVYADKALYVHTVMVKEISRLLLERILDDAPELVEGVCGRDVDYIRSHKEEMLALMEKCAMCHDIGKHFLIDIVSNSSRRLTDDEFGVIKTHPQNFSIVYENDRMEETEELKCIRDCALLHHRWHNGKGGYPDIPTTKNMPFADILAIADSLDAATDSIGRPYGIGKTLDDLIGEFLEMGGTRYSREVAEVLAKPDVRDAVNEIITKRREEVNYRIYAFNEIES